MRHPAIYLYNRPFPSLILCLLVLTLAGCGTGDKAGQLLAEANDCNIKRLSSLYAVYQGQHRFKGPKDEAEFKTFIAAQVPKRLKQIGVEPDKLDQLFVSERDNLPFQIRWGLIGNPRQGPVPIVFEQTGVDGIYMVAFSGFACEEVDQVRYDQLWKGKLDGVAPENRPK